jgi:adenylate kinase
MKIAVIIYGSPGSGKGTQAQLLADKLGLIHFDTGKYIRGLIYDPKYKNNKIIQKERKLNEVGGLNTPLWVLKIVSNKVKEIKELFHRGVILSGSPRTMFEAFGDDNNVGLVEKLGKIFGKKNIFIFKINVSEKESVERNTHRLVCSVCRTPLLSQMSNVKCQMFKKCPFCGGILKHRFDDTKKIITNRLKEYKERTTPIFTELKKRKYKVIEINGKPLPSKVNQSILKWVLR